MIVPPALPPAAASPTTSSEQATAATNYADVNSLEQLKQNPHSPETLHAVAQQVEALFLQMMLKSMRDASPDGGIFDSNEGQLYQDMFDKQIALSMSQHQEVGIGELLMRQLMRNSSPDADAASPPTSSASAKGFAQTAAIAATPREFVAKVMPTIETAARKIGVNPVGMLAQAALETGWGRRVVKTGAGASSHNLFGVKTGASWSGPSVNATTLEYDRGVAVQKRATFRAYASIEEGINDYAHLMASSPRYRAAVAAGASADSYVQAVAASGYATDPDYGNKLNQILNSDTMRSALSPPLARLQK